MNVRITPKGTELPLLNFKGKPYLQVAHRLVWFREENPTGVITTELVDKGENWALYKAQVSFVDLQKQTSLVVATAHKKEYEENFPDYHEKAETGAIGRALAIAGFGTQFEPELDEGVRLADSPIQPAKKRAVEVVTNAQVKETKSAAPVAKAATETTVEKNQDRENVNKLIAATAKVALDKKSLTKEALSAMISTYNGATKKEDLSDEQAKEFLAKLTALVKG